MVVSASPVAADRTTRAEGNVGIRWKSEVDFDRLAVGEFGSLVVPKSEKNIAAIEMCRCVIRIRRAASS